MGTFPTAPSFVAGESTGVAAKLTSLKTVMDFLSNPPRCYAYCSAATSIATATDTVVPLAGEVFDIVQSGDPGMHDTATLNSRVVARTAGKYEVTGQIEYATNATGSRVAIVRLNAAGTTGGTTLYQTVQGAVSGNFSSVPVVAFEVALGVGDYIELFAYQTSGSSVSVNAGQGRTFLRMKLVGS